MIEPIDKTFKHELYHSNTWGYDDVQAILSALNNYQARIEQLEARCDMLEKELAFHAKEIPALEMGEDI